MSKIIKAVFTGRFCTTRRVFQWDSDDKLQFVNLDLPQNYTVDFANSLTGQSVPVLATSDTVQIPPDLFVPGSEIYAWVWVSDTNGGHTKCQTTIPIDPRAQRSGTSPAPAQASAWDQAVQTLNDAAADYETAASHAPIIQNGYWFIWDSTAGEYVTTDVKAAGADGENGNIIWWTTDHVTASGDNAGIQRRKLHGPEGLTPAVGDYVFAPAAGNEGEPTTLYVIISSSATVIMTALGRIVGPAGYSPEVTISEITGGHRVTITDEDHPDGQSFDVMDGQGGSGSSDYDDLSNKPQVNNVTLSGNKSLSDLGIEPEAFVVTITQSGSTYSADKTYSDTVAAVTAGKRVVAILNSIEYQLFTYVANSYTVVFTANQGTTAKTIALSLGNVVAVIDTSLGTYSKPSGGIPKTDLASAVQTSLGKADTALQPGDVSEPFFVTYSTSDGTTWTCDKTFTQIVTAMSAQKDISVSVMVGATRVAQTCEITLQTDGGTHIELWVRSSRITWNVAKHYSDETISVTNDGLTYADVDAVASDQGSAHAGEFLVVGNDGIVTTMTLATWQGGSY